MTIKTEHLLKLLQVLAWFIFIGVCIDAGGIISNTIYSICVDANFASKFWNHTNLGQVYQFNQASYVTLTTLMSIATSLKAFLFYLIIKMFHDKKLNLAEPFTDSIKKYISNFAYLSLGIAIFSKWGSDLCNWLSEQKLAVPSVQHLKIGGADVWFLMFFILIMISKIFKRGIELQSENELTV